MSAVGLKPAGAARDLDGLGTVERHRVESVASERGAFGHAAQGGIDQRDRQPGGAAREHGEVSDVLRERNGADAPAQRSIGIE